MLYDLIDGPIDARRLDYLVASVVQAIANTHLGNNQKPYTLEDSLMKFGERDEKPKVMSAEKIQTLARILGAMADAHRPT